MNYFSEKIFVHIPYNLIETHINKVIENQLNIEIYLSSKTLDKFHKDHFIKYSNICKRNNIKVTIHAPYIDLSPGGMDEKIKNITMERFNYTINVGEIFHAESIVFHSGFEEFRHRTIFDKWLEESIHTWKAVIQKASHNNIQVLLENIFDVTPEVLLILSEELGNKSFGFCFDSGHFNLFSEISLEQWIKKTSTTIKECHLHNNYGKKDNHNNMADGTFDFSNLFSLMKSYNIFPNLTIEAHGINEVFKSLDYIQKL